MTDCVTKVEEEKKKVVTIAKRLDLVLAGDSNVTRRIDFDLRPSAREEENDTEFLSFDEDDEEEEKFDHVVETLVKAPPTRKASGIRPQDLNSNRPSGSMNNIHPWVKV